MRKRNSWVQDAIRIHHFAPGIPPNANRRTAAMAVRDSRLDNIATSSTGTLFRSPFDGGFQLANEVVERRPATDPSDHRDQVVVPVDVNDVLAFP